MGEVDGDPPLRRRDDLPDAVLHRSTINSFELYVLHYKVFFFNSFQVCKDGQLAIMIEKQQKVVQK